MQMNALSTTAVSQYDKETLVNLYESYSPGIYRYAYRLIGDQDHAEECVAETFSRFLRAARAGKTFDNPQAYLYRMAHNWITDLYRRQPPLEELDEDLHAGHEHSPDHQVDQALESQRLRAAMRNLPEEQRLVVSLRFLENRSHEEAAAVLGKSAEATRALQYRALAALRRMLGEQEMEKLTTMMLKMN